MFVLVLGLGTVFAGLFCLIILTKLMSAVLSKSSKNESKQPSTAVQTAPVSAQPAPAFADATNIPNRQQFVAAVSAAIATYMGTDVSGLRIRSIKVAGASDDRQQMVAAMSAAIASAMDTEPSGLRIHSIKKI